MQLTTIDWIVILTYGCLALGVGLYFTRQAGQNRETFFLSNRKLPWWLLGTSMVATTFSTDTPNLVTNIVRTGGVSHNWLWWSFLITGMCTVFFYARLWRRSGVLTDIGFYELRYSGKSAAFLRAFRSLYLGFFFNIIIMATVTLAAIKIGGVLLGLDKYSTVLICASIVGIYSATSGLSGVVVTDLLLFILAMIGSIAAAYYALRQPQVDGLSGLIAHPMLAGKLNMLPDFSDSETVAVIFIVPLAVQWWSTWYPGSEPGGGGFVAQRMLAARNEKESMWATLWFNIAHYALRPWPWLIVALCSMIVYPTLESIQARFPDLDPTLIRHDLAYPAMLVLLPHGLLGLVVASLAAAYMSTISTHLNWGASYIVNDVYRRFVSPKESERHYVAVGRSCTILLLILASIVSLYLESALQGFQIMLQIGAGTGLIFLLRWFWWRISAWSEISAMTISFLIALYFQFIHERLGWPALHPSWNLVIGAVLTTLGWLIVTLLTPPTDISTLRKFHQKVRPLGKGWNKVIRTTCSNNMSAKSRHTLTKDEAAKGNLSAAFLGWFSGCLAVYSALFGTGYYLYNMILPFLICGVIFCIATFLLLRSLNRTFT